MDPTPLFLWLLRPLIWLSPVAKGRGWLETPYNHSCPPWGSRTELQVTTCLPSPSTSAFSWTYHYVGLNAHVWINMCVKLCDKKLLHYAEGLCIFFDFPANDTTVFHSCKRQATLCRAQTQWTVSSWPQCIVRGQASSTPLASTAHWGNRRKEREREINRKRRQGEGLGLARWGKGCPGSAMSLA